MEGLGEFSYGTMFGPVISKKMLAIDLFYDLGTKAFFTLPHRSLEQYPCWLHFGWLFCADSVSRFKTSIGRRRENARRQSACHFPVKPGNGRRISLNCGAPFLHAKTVELLARSRDYLAFAVRTPSSRLPLSPSLALLLVRAKNRPLTRSCAFYSSGLKTASDKHAAHSCQGLLVDKRHLFDNNFCSNKNWPCTLNQAVHAQMATVHGAAHDPSLINTRAGPFVRVPKIFIE